MSLYDDLGVPEDASEAEIKRAYRIKAQKVHPDKRGGDTEKFQGVKHAYEVLSDRSRRERYDRTGLEDQSDNYKRAVTHIVSLLFSLIEQVEQLDRVDMIGTLRERVKNEEEEDLKEIHRIQEGLEKRKRILRRLRRKVVDGKPNSLADAVANDIKDRERRIQEGLEALEHHKLVRKVLDEYVDEADVVRMIMSGLVAPGRITHWPADV